MKTKPKIYTAEFVLEDLNKMLIELEKDQGICFIGELFLTRKYSHNRFSEWAEEYKDHAEISVAIMKIRGVIETRTYKRALEGQYNAKIAQFGLINNHNWRDKRELDVAGTIRVVDEIVVRYTGETGNEDRD